MSRNSERKTHFKRGSHILCGLFFTNFFSYDEDDVDCANCLRVLYRYYVKDECVICGPDRWFGLINHNDPVNICYCRNCGNVQAISNGRN